jgi:hypothetical protein
MKTIRLLIIVTVGLALTLAALSVLGITVPEVRAATRTVCPPPGGPGCDDTDIQIAIGSADPGDTIIITAGQYDGHVTIPKSLTLQGAGVGKTILRGQNDDIFLITGNDVDVNLIGMTIRDGKIDNSGAGIDIDTENGTHVISDCLITDNVTDDGDAGGIKLGGKNNQLTIISTTIRNNSAQPGHGGGIIFVGLTSTLQIVNSAILFNSAAGSGGGIAFMDAGSSSVLTITNSTISGNQAGESGGGLTKSPNTGPVYLNNVTIANNNGDSDENGSGVGGGIAIPNSGGATYIANTLIADNIDNSNAPDCTGGTIASQGYNLIGDGTGCGWGAATGDQIGPSVTVTPGLGILFGSPPYHILISDSTAIGGGNATTPGSGFPACEALDQAGRARPMDSRCDTGAYEYDSSLVVYSVYLPIVVKNN